MTPDAPPVVPQGATTLRPAAQVMRLARLGALQQGRLSFARLLTRKMAAERWAIACADWSVAPDGTGHALYVADCGPRRYALLAVSDVTGAGVALCDGQPDAAGIARLAAALARPDTARLTEAELCCLWLHHDANLCDHLRDSLASGRQPAADRIAGGALMHAGPAHAAGKLGTADRDLIADRPEMHAPFQAELLALYLARLFARDLAQHGADTAARAAGRTAARLDPALACSLGIGFSAGLGLASFPVTHPCLFNTWIMAREEAIARVSALPEVSDADWTRVRNLARGQQAAAAAARATHPVQSARDRALAADLASLAAEMAAGPSGRRPWGALMAWADHALGPDGQEALASLMLEPYGARIDALAHCMSDTLDRDFRIDGSLPVGRMRALIAAVHGWALPLDWGGGPHAGLAWSMRHDLHDPQLVPRASAARAPFELPLAVVRDAVAAWHTLARYPDETPVATVLLAHPDHRSAIRRAQITAFSPYAEIRDNLIDQNLRPVDILRATLSFLGATDFDPPCDRRMRARFFAGAPYPETLPQAGADLWVYPAGAP